MVFNLTEYQLPSLIISVIIAYQLAGYFFYQYVKLRKEKIDLNNVLLAYGCFFFLSFSGILCRTIGNFFLEDPLYSEVFLKMSYILVTIAVIAFLFIIVRGLSRDLFNPIIVKIILVLSLIPIFLVILISTEDTLFVLTMLPVAFGFLYIILFQYKLIKLTKGEFQGRMKLIFFGELLIFISLALGSLGRRTLIPNTLDGIAIILSVPFSFSGLTMIFVAILNIPSFLEFGWKKNLIKLYIIDGENLRELYAFDFRYAVSFDRLNETKMAESEDMIPKAIIGIETIISRCTEEKNGKTERIRQEDLTILIGHGDSMAPHLIYALIVKQEMNSLNYVLKSIKTQFQDFFKEILLKLKDIEGDIQVFFSSFDFILKSIIN